MSVLDFFSRLLEIKKISKERIIYFNIREKNVIQVSFRPMRGEWNIFNIFCIRGEENVYFNIRWKKSVIQISFKVRKCNLLFTIFVFV